MDKTTALIDIDGVINHATRFSDRYAAQYGANPDTLAPFFTGPFQECLVGKRDLKEELALVLPSWGWPGTVEELLHFWFAGEVQASAAVVSAIKELHERGVRCIGASNQEKYRMQYLKNALRLNEYFDYLFSSAEVGYKKPDPRFYRYIMEQTATPSDKIAYWDDDPENVAAAAKLGIESHLFLSEPEFIRQATPLLNCSSEPAAQT